MILIGLNLPEIQRLALVEAVVAVQTENGGIQQVRRYTHDVADIDGRVIEPLIARAHAVLLDYPDELLHAMIEDNVDGGLGCTDGDGLSGRILHLLNEIFVVVGSEPFALFGVQIDEIAEELDTVRGDGIDLGAGRGTVTELL